MFFSCPHCRDLVATDRETNLPPLMCPRCGGTLRQETTVAPATTGAASGKPSFVSLLHGASPTPSAAGAETEMEMETETERPGDPAETSTDEAGDANGAAVEESSSEAIDDEIHAVAKEGSEAIATASEPVVPPAPQPAASTSANEYQGPSFIRQRAQPVTPARTARWQWVALVLLATVLGLQVLLADRTRLAADATWRPIISSLCRLAGCSVPAWHQPGAFAMLSRDVSPIPGSAGGLNVQATFRNDARWPQAWPVLILSLSDADGRVLGSRAFSPKEYLGAAAAQTELAPGQSAQIALKIREPDPDVVAFSFDFR